MGSIIYLRKVSNEKRTMVYLQNSVQKTVLNYVNIFLFGSLFSGQSFYKQILPK